MAFRPVYDPTETKPLQADIDFFRAFLKRTPYGFDALAEKVAERVLAVGISLHMTAAINSVLDKMYAAKELPLSRVFSDALDAARQIVPEYDSHGYGAISKIIARMREDRADDFGPRAWSDEHAIAGTIQKLGNKGFLTLSATGRIQESQAERYAKEKALQVSLIAEISQGRDTYQLFGRFSTNEANRLLTLPCSDLENMTLEQVQQRARDVAEYRRQRKETPEERRERRASNRSDSLGDLNDPNSSRHLGASPSASSPQWSEQSSSSAFINPDTQQRWTKKEIIDLLKYKTASYRILMRDHAAEITEILQGR